MARNPETRLQIVVVDWLKSCLPDGAEFWATLNERNVSPRAGKLANLMGRRAGVSDLMVLWSRRLFCIELKVEADPIKGTKKTYARPDQREFGERIKRAGGVYAVCRHTDEVEALLRSYGVPVDTRAWTIRQGLK